MLLVGIDEVGRGCWAGPLVAGAVVLENPIKGLRDSKKLTKLQRERLDADIRIQALAIGLGWVIPQELDEVGMSKAVRIAMERALAEIKIFYEQIIIDGDINYLKSNPKSKAVIRADDSVPSVSAASIIAKVARDHYMVDASKSYFGYGFDRNVGYGTAFHRNALLKYGICKIHRLSFKPVAAYIGKKPK